MPTTVRIPDVGLVRFPDGMSADDISVAIRERILPRTKPVLGPSSEPAFDTGFPPFRETKPAETPEQMFGIERPPAVSLPEPSSASGIVRRAIADPAISLARGIVGLPEAVVGLADIPTLGYAGKLLEAGGYGFQPKLTKEWFSRFYSPELKAAEERVRQAKGFVGTLEAMVENPSTIAQTVVEAVPSMLGGAAAARKAISILPRLAPVVAGAAGEAAITAGQTAEAIRQQKQSGLLTPQQAALSASSGTVTGLIGVLGGGLAKRLGITDVDTLLAGGRMDELTAKKSVLRRIAESAVVEGALEELPQTAQELIHSNIAQNKPWNEGVAEAAATGLLAGLIMGGVGGAIPPRPPPTTELRKEPEYALQKRIAATLPMGQAPEAGAEVGARIPEPKEVAPKPPPVQQASGAVEIIQQTPVATVPAATAIVPPAAPGKEVAPEASSQAKPGLGAGAATTGKPAIESPTAPQQSTPVAETKAETPWAIQREKDIARHAQIAVEMEEAVKATGEIPPALFAENEAIKNRYQGRVPSDPSIVEPGAAKTSPESIGQELSRLIEQRLSAGQTITRNDLRNIRTSVDSENKLDDKQIDEFAEFGLVLAAKKIVEDGRIQNQSNPEIFDRLVGLYNRQPNLSTRTNVSRIAQAYSTPAPLAFIADVLADVRSGQRILESTAGHGMLLIDAPHGRAWVNELDAARLSKLRQLQFARISGLDATSAVFGEAVRGYRPDRAVINPPFGSIQRGGRTMEFELAGTTGLRPTKALDYAIAMNTLQGLDPAGKATLILGAKTGTSGALIGSSEQRIKSYQTGFHKALYDTFNVVDHFTVSGDLYEKQGAGFPVDMIVIDGRGQSAMVRPWVTAPRVISTWDELKATISREPRRGPGIRPSGAGGGIGMGGTPVRPSADRSEVGHGRAPEEPGTSQPAPIPGRPSEISLPEQLGTGGKLAEPAPEKPAAGIKRPAGAGVAEPGGGHLEQSPASESRLVSKAIEFQAPYRPQSKLASDKLLTPTNLETPERDALNALERKVGDIDKFVAGKLGIPGDLKRLSQWLSAAQVDATGLAIHNIENGTALILGDQTGVGKGRVIAALIRYAILNNKVPVFITAKNGLYSDMIGRDLAGVEFSSKVNPLITNKNLNFTDMSGREFSTGDPTSFFESISATGKMSQPFNAIFTTYSQIASDKPKGFRETPRDKARRLRNNEMAPPGFRVSALRAIAPEAIFILDESHSAAGQSEVGRRLIDMLQRAYGTYYSSGTFAKNPATMALYYQTTMRHAGLTPDQLLDVLKSGGVPLQQTVASMLAKDGQYLRREQSWDGVKFDFKLANPKNHERELELVNEYTSYLQELNRFSLYLDQYVSALNESAHASGEMIEGISTAPDLSKINFGSRLFTFSQQYLFSLKADAIADEALAVLKSGRKPFLAVSNTFEGPMTDIAAKGYPLNFTGMLLRQLDKLMEVKKKTFGAKEYETIKIAPEDLPDGGARYYRLKKLVEDADLGGMPLSPIDHIKQRLQAAGYSFGEITGRKQGLDKNGQIYAREKGETTTRGKLKTLADYNNGRLDALLINASGSTGLSAHSGIEFKDQRQRVMIVGQAQPDINEFMQTLGRIKRKGEVVLPEYIILLSALPAEKRFAAMLKRKLSSLNANTTAAAESEVTSKKEFTENIFNEYGDDVVVRVMESNPQAVALLPHLFEEGMPSVRTFADEKEEGQAASQITGHMVLLPVEEQQRLWDQIENEYLAKIKFLDETGENKLKATALDYAADTTDRTIVYEGTGESQFDGPAILETVQVKEQKKPLALEKIKELVSDAEQEAQQQFNAYKDGLAKARNAEVERRAKALGSEFTQEIQQSINDRYESIFSKVREAYNMLGQEVSLDFTGGGKVTMLGIVSGIHLNPADPRALSKQNAIVHVNSGKVRITIPVSQLADSVAPYRGEDFSRDFEQTAETSNIRKLITGNLLAGYKYATEAAEGAHPRVIIYTTKDGRTITGIQMPASFNQIKLTPIRDGAAFLTSLNNLEVIQSQHSVRIVRNAQSRIITISMPAARNIAGAIWADERINQFLKGGQLRQSQGNMTGEVLPDRLAALGEFLIREKGQQLFFEGRQAPPSAQYATGTETIDERLARATGIKYPGLAQGMTVPAVATAINEFLGTAELPSGITVISDPTKTWGAVITGRNRITVNAARVTPETVIRKVLEEGIHGIWNDPQFAAGRHEFENAIRPTDIEAERKTREAQGLPTDEATILEETAIARLLADAPKDRSIIDRFLDAIVSAVNRVFGTDFKRTGQNRSQILAAAVSFLRSRQAGAPAEGELFATGISREQEQAEFIRSEIPRLVEPIVREYETARNELDASALDNALARTARGELDRAAEYGRTEAERAGLSERDYPSPADPDFAEKLQALGVTVDPRRVKEAQGNLILEQAARTQANRIRALAQSERELTNLQKYDPVTFADFIVELKDQADKLRKAIATPRDSVTKRLKETLGALAQTPDWENRIDNWRSEITRRGLEIRQTDLNKPDLEARRDALTLPQVRKTFIEPIEGARSMVERMGAQLKEFRATLADPAVSLEQKQSMAVTVMRSIFEFAKEKQDFDGYHASRRQSLLKQIKRLETQIADAKVDAGMAEILLNDAYRTMNGEEGLTGDLRSVARVEQLKATLEAVKTFAQRLNKPPEEGRRGAQAIRNLLIDPASDQDLSAVNPADLGVSREVFDNIVWALKESPAFRDAVRLLSDFTDRKLRDLPATRLEAIADALAEDQPEVAQAIFQQLQAKLENRISAQDAINAQKTKELYDAGVELKALAYAKILFDSVSGTSERPNNYFFALKHDADALAPYAQKMIVSNGGDPNAGGVTVTFRAFRERPEVKVSARDSLLFGAQKGKELDQWFADAEQYVFEERNLREAFEKRLSDVTPESLGYDRVIARGLADAIANDYAIYRDPSIGINSAHLKTPWLERKMLRIGYWQQLLRGLRQVNGVVGRDVIQKLVQLANYELAAKQILHQHQDIIALRSAALRSHPELGNNLERYQVEIFNEMAPEGRLFGSELKAGMNLPRHGKNVTAQDMALLRRVIQLEEALRRRIAETRPTTGVVEEIGGRKLVRAGAYVGDLGLPRHMGGLAKEFIEEIIAAYDPRNAAIDRAADLGANATHPTAVFWNSHIGDLLRHVLDAGRPDRIMRQEDYMLEAERKLAERIRADNGAPDLKTLDDYINALSDPSVFPSGTGVVPREYVRNELLEELSQYNRNAKQVIGKLSEMATSTGVEIGTSMHNEFTKPAAKLMFPSDRYEYGAISDAQLLQVTARATHQRMIELVSAMERAYASLEVALKEFAKGRRVEQYDNNYKEVYDTHRIIGDLLDKLKQIASVSDASRRTGFFWQPDSLITQSLLAIPTVGLKNAGLGTITIFAQKMAIARTSRALAAMGVAKDIVSLAIRGATYLGTNPNWKVTRGVRDFILNAGRKDFTGLVRYFANEWVNPAVTDARKVQALGFSQRDPYFKTVADIWRKANELQSEQERFRTTQIGRYARATKKTLVLSASTVGTAWYDLLLNSLAVNYAGQLEQGLRQLAMRYGQARETLGEFKPDNDAWLVKPDEYSNRVTGTGRKDAMAAFRQLMESSGVSLEHALWNYYQATKRGEHPEILNQEQFDGVMRALMREFNAADITNRALSIRSSPLVRALSVFHGYIGDAMLKMVGAFAGTRDKDYAAKLQTALPVMLSIALAAAIAGLSTQAVTDEYRRVAQNMIGRNASIIDKEFWTSYDHAKEASTLALLSALPGFGDLALLARNQVAQNKGFDPAGRILAVNVANDALAAAQGVWALRGSPGDWPTPLVDFGRRYAAFSAEVLRITNPRIGGQREFSNAVNSWVSGMKSAGLETPQKAGARSRQKVYTEAGVIRESMVAAAMLEDWPGFDAEKLRLVEYYRKRGIANPERSAERDFQNANPVVRANAGKYPTPDEFRQVRTRLSGERARALDSALAKWQQGMARIETPRIAPVIETARLPEGPQPYRRPRLRTLGFPTSRRRRSLLRGLRTRRTRRPRLRSLRSRRSRLRALAA